MWKIEHCALVGCYLLEHNLRTKLTQNEKKIVRPNYNRVRDLPLLLQSSPDLRFTQLWLFMLTLTSTSTISHVNCGLSARQNLSSKYTQWIGPVAQERTEPPKLGQEIGIFKSPHFLICPLSFHLPFLFLNCSIHFSSSKKKIFTH